MRKEQFVFLSSDLSKNDESLNKRTNEFLNELDYQNIDFESNIFFIKSGGSEEPFLKIYKRFNAPFYLLATDNSNSLASALEIISYLKKENIDCYLFSGKPEEVKEAIKNFEKYPSKYYELKDKIPLLNGTRIGLIGKSSNWLIASDVDYRLAKEKLGVDIIDIPFDELLLEINKIDDKNVDVSSFKKDENKTISLKEIKKAYKIYLALKNIVKRYSLSGLSLRCFDLLDTYHSTGCLALALLNSEGIISSCEGDIPSLLSMMILYKASSSLAFQCNPSYINVKENYLYLAHCTLPLKMANSYVFDTHFESGIGLGIHGELKEGPVTIFKLAPSLDKFILEEGVIEKNMYRFDLCRSQIKVLVKDVKPFISSPLGNHLLISYSNLKDQLLLILEKNK